MSIRFGYRQWYAGKCLMVLWEKCVLTHLIAQQKCVCVVYYTFFSYKGYVVKHILTHYSCKPI